MAARTRAETVVCGRSAQRIARCRVAAVTESKSNRRMALLSTDTVAARPVPAGPMLYVSLLIELLRSRPELLFWTATLAQAFLWVLVPTLTYSAPPGNVPLVLAAGHEWVAGSRLGPPLANWVAEVAFDLSGRHLFGIYLLSQICVVISFWAV